MLPSLRHLIRHGLLPTELHEPAIRGSDTSWLTEEGQQEERQALVGRYLDWLISWAIREVRVDDEWVSARIAPETVAGMAVDDRDLLEDVILRDKTPAEASAASRAFRIIERLDVPDAPADDGEVAIPGWSEFRGRGRGPAAGDDGEGVADEAERPAGAGG